MASPIGGAKGDELPTDTATAATAVEGDRPRHAGAIVLGPMSQIDRFVILEKLGEGGMGTVFAAYDGMLDRKVALKVVRADRRGAIGTVTPRDRLLREAQAMAKLSHPNVMGVLQVGEIGDDIYIALEYVDGTTIKKWTREQTRSWPAILAAFQQAGRGLAAAHDAGMVHRDFKPDNVLVRRDGRIQVIDFGVVSLHGGRDGTPPNTPLDRDTDPDRELPSPTPAGSSQEQFTYAGMRVGTPAYMAPEQFELKATDARADQFGFCVALWEALYGRRPFSGDDTRALHAAMTAGSIEPPPRDTAVPRRIEAALRRGLSADPTARWPNMQTLLRALAHDPWVARRRALIAGAAALALGLTGAIAWVGWTRRPAAGPRCEEAGQVLAERWDAERARGIREAFAATELPYAAGAADDAVSRLEAWSRSWVDARVATCDAHRRGERSDRLLDAGMRCLDRRLDDVAELVSVLTEADRGVVERSASASLPDVAPCADLDALLEVAPPPTDPEVRRALAVIEHDLSRARAQESAGRYPVAREIATAAAAQAVALDDQAIRAEALYLRGRLEVKDGAAALAGATLDDASSAAARAHLDGLIAAALVEAVYVHVHEARGAEAMAAATAARAAVLRAGDRALEAYLLDSLGDAHALAGDLPAAVAAIEQGLAVRRDLGDEVQIAQSLNHLANLHQQLRRGDAARAAYGEALQLVERRLGAAHPSTAVTRANLCYLDAERGQLTAGRACQEEVVTTLEAALGDEHPMLAWALNDVALIQLALGDTAGATARFERALAIWEATSGRDHPDVAWPLVNLGMIAADNGELELAEARCGRALDVITNSEGADHPDAAMPLICLGAARADHAPREALADLVRVEKLWEVAPPEPGDEAIARFARARALANIGSKDAIASARRAAALVATPPTPGAEPDAGQVALAARIEAWLRARGG